MLFVAGAARKGNVMGMRLWKTIEAKEFGDLHLIAFLEKNGAESWERSAIDVPVRALRAALGHAKELMLTEEAIAFIESEIQGRDDDDIICWYDIV